MAQDNRNGKRAILLVEDEPVISRVCVKSLTAEGFEVDIAVNGNTASTLQGRR